MNSQVRPLSLGLHSEVSADFLEAYFHLPAPKEPLQDLTGMLIEVGAEQGARVSNLPLGSRTSTQRMGTGGRPVWYQTAVAEVISTRRWPSPYQF